MGSPDGQEPADFTWGTATGRRTVCVRVDCTTRCRVGATCAATRATGAGAVVELDVEVDVAVER
jgi:hypothetical protein